MQETGKRQEKHEKTVLGTAKQGSLQTNNSNILVPKCHSVYCPERISSASRSRH